MQFKEKSNWKECILEKCCRCFDNKRKPISSELREKGSIPYYGANGIQDYVKDYIFNGEYILLAEDGGHFDEFLNKPIAQYITGKSWVNNHAHVLQGKNDNITQYIFYSLVHKDIRKYINGSSRAKLNKEDMWQIKIFLPETALQQKIANFLSLVDQRIEKQRQLVESLKKYKRGLLSAIFDHKLRFKDENGNDYPEWDNFVLDNLGSFYNGLSGKNKDDFGTGNSEYITYMNVFKNTIANETICERVNILPNEHQNIVNFGDLLFTQSSETMEEVGFCSVWNSHKKVFLNSFCFGLHFNNSKFAYPQFMAHYMRSYKIRLLIMRESQGATRINLSSERLKKIELSLPPYKEQKIIAHFIERYDNTIQNEEKKLEMFNNLKQGLLQQMFI